MRGLIRSARAALRPLVPADAPAVAALIGEFDVSRMLARAPHPYAVADAEGFIARVAGADWTRAIEIDGALAGCCGVDPKLGYWLGRPFWGRGLMSEVAGALVDAWFAAEPGDAIEAGHFADNPASRRILDKLGFREIGRSLLHSAARGCDVDHVDMRLTREDRERAR